MLLRLWIVLICVLLTPTIYAQPTQNIESSQVAWYLGEKWTHSDSIEQYLQTLTPVDSFNLTGGQHVSVVRFNVEAFNDYVIDFSNSALIGEFQHDLLNANGEVVATRTGGINTYQPTEFFLRHGQSVQLPVGHYTLVTYQLSQFNIAPPTPFVLAKNQYVADIRLGNAITLMGLGIFAALFVYYLVLSMARSSLVDASYAVFILGNLLFNSSTLLVVNHLFGVSWFGGASWPIFFSNIAYIIFVMTLLNVSRANSPKLWLLGVGVITIFLIFLVSALFYPHWQNEFNRIAVGIFMLFGMVCGVLMAFRGSVIARLYLLANAGFFVLGMIAISQEKILGLNTIYMSHIGLIAVAIEVLLLSSVVAYQMVLLENEKTQALKQAKEMLTIAHTDPLTGLPNRYAMEKRLLQVQLNESFIYIDLDGLKLCNDNYGHDMGDKLLLLFSEKLQNTIPMSCSVFRISGDEFGVVFNNDVQQKVINGLGIIEHELKAELNTSVGVSFGIARFKDYSNHQQTVTAADEDMYINKKRKKALSA